MKFLRYMNEEIISKSWIHQWMVLTIDKGGKGAYINYSGFLTPGGREINKNFLVKDWKTAEKKIKAYIKKLPYDEKDYEVTTIKR